MHQNTSMEEGALVYMDNIIQRTLLPEFQDEAVNAVIHFLERPDAFDPIANDVFTRYPHHTVQVCGTWHGIWISYAITQICFKHLQIYWRIENGQWMLY